MQVALAVGAGEKDVDRADQDARASPEGRRDMIGTSLGHYRIDEKVGSGGMGEVYRARDERLDRDVALKILPPGKLEDQEARSRFRREALALSRLNHPAIATIHDIGSDRGIDFLVMEFIEGPTLEERLARAGPLSEEEILRIGQQLAEAVADAHDRGIVHRDLKPSNIKLVRGGRVKVLDFGLARLWDEAAGAESELPLTATRAAVGTVPYMAPEQLEGGPPSPKSDIWALGAVLFEAATGEPPFRGKTVYELATAILHGAPGPLPGTLSGGLRAIIERCLQKDPERRFRNAGELRVALETIDSAPFRQLPTPGRRIRRRGVLIGLGAVVLAGLLGVVTLQLRSGAAGGPTLAAIESIVALPARVVGPEEDGFLADALPQTISTQLSGVRGLATRVPPTTVEFARLEDDLGRAAEAYDVGAFVLSTVTSRSDRLVLNVQLVDAATRRVLWGDEYEGARGAYVDLVRRAAEDIRATLRPTAEPVPVTGPTRSSEAELALQRGLHHLNLFYTSGRAQDYERAAASFERALELDSIFAEAAAGIAQIRLLELARGGDPARAMSQAASWAQRAIELDPRSSQAWQVLSALEDLRPDGDARKSLEDALRAVTYDPGNNYAYVALANVLMKTSGELAVAVYTEAQRQNPLDLSALAAAAGPLSLLGRTEEAVARVDRVLRIEPDLPYALMTKALVLTVHGRTAESAEMVTRLERLVGEGRLSPGIVGFARDLHDFVGAMERGERSAARPAMERLRRLARGEGELFPYWDRATHAMGPLFARYGETEAAIAILWERFERGIPTPYDVLVWNPDLESLRGAPGFEKILAAGGDRFENTVAILEAAAERDELPAFLSRTLDDLKARLAVRTS